MSRRKYSSDPQIAARQRVAWGAARNRKRKRARAKRIMAGVRAIGKGVFEVPSFSEPGKVYLVEGGPGPCEQWRSDCECKGGCSHRRAAAMALGIEVNWNGQVLA